MKKLFLNKTVKGLRRYIIPDEIARKMFDLRDDILKNTYPNPNQVGSVVLTKDGNMYQGIDYRTNVMILTMHAEATALAHAAIHGEKEIIAVTGENCHACKQILWESGLLSGNDLIVLILENNKIKKIPLSSMMKYAWPKV